jgi:DNA-binding transcriptional LysR family regulator
MQALPSSEDLQCFCEVARLASFKGAARALALTPGAVSQRIRNLEALLGVALFARTTRSVALTLEGHAFLAHAPLALAALELALRAGRGQSEVLPMELHLGTRHELGMSWVVPMLPGLRRALPAITFHLYFGSGPDLLLRVRSSEIDCAVTSSRLTDPKLAAHVLHEERYVLVASPKLLARLPFTRREHGARHTLIDSDVGRPLSRYLREAPGGVGDLKFAALRRMGTISAIRAMVLAEEGVAVLPEYYVREDLDRRRLRRLLPNVPILHDHFRLVFRGDDPRTGYFDALATHMRACALK